jgi:peptide/nickel transport system ATP-binding protein
MLELEDLTIRYGQGKHSLTAVDRLSFSIPTGSTLGLVGESGCGKSTVARAIVGLVNVASGAIRLDGEDFTEERMRNRQSFRRRVQMIFQDPYASLNPRMTVGEMLAEAVDQVPRDRRDNRETEVRALADRVGLPGNALARYPHQFSGGQRQRVAIARALAVRPEFIVTDEVTSALDVSVQAAILNLLRDLQRDLGLTYLFISHDLSAVRYMSDAVAVMYLGRMVEVAPVEDLFQSPSNPYTRALLSSVPQVGEPRRPAPLSGDLPDPSAPPPGCRFHTRCPEGPLSDPTRTVCWTTDPQHSQFDKRHLSACHFAPAATASG